MREKGYLTRAQRDSIQALPIELDFRPISHNAGTGTYFREMLRMVMTSGKPSRESFGPARPATGTTVRPSSSGKATRFTAGATRT